MKGKKQSNYEKYIKKIMYYLSLMITILRPIVPQKNRIVIHHISNLTLIMIIIITKERDREKENNPTLTPNSNPNNDNKRERERKTETEVDFFTTVF